MENIKDYALKELESSLGKNNLRPFCARQIFNWVYKKRVEDFSLMTDISKDARVFLADNFYSSRLKLIKKQTSEDKTTKFLFGLDDSTAIETVLIPEGKRNTLCVSTQVGCKFKCKFCASGFGGLVRNLTVAEIINQYLEVSDRILPKRITNIVFMGIGEPLDNFDNLIKSIKILTESKGICIGKGKICVSTCGIIPQIHKLLAEKLGVKLSISLHCADNNKRTSIMPVNKKYPLSEVLRVAGEFARVAKYPVTFEYILIKDFNCSADDAVRLAKLLKSVDHKMNIIPYNESVNFSWRVPQPEEIKLFTDKLKEHKIFFVLRKPRGGDIKASCGQLAHSG